MAKQRNDNPKGNPQRQPVEPLPPDDVEDVEEVEEVLEAGEEPKPKKTPAPPAKTPMAKGSAQPTQLAKKSPGPTQVAPPDEMPNLSLDAAEETPIPAEVVDEVVDEDVIDAEEIVPAQPASDVLADEVFEAQPVSAGSSVVQAEEVVEDAEVLDSGVLSGDVLASPSDVVKAAPATSPSQSKVEDIIAADARKEDDWSKSSSSIFGSRREKEEAPALPESSESMARKQATIEEILNIAELPEEEAKAKEAAEIDDETVDLGSMPEVEGGTAGSKKPRSKEPRSGVDPVAEALESGVNLDAADQPAPKKKAAAETEEISADDLFTAEDEAEAAAAKQSKAITAEEEEEAVAQKPKGKVPENEDEERELVGAGRGRPVKPKYGRRWLGGMFLGMILVGGAGAGVWYLQPDLLEEAYQAHPNYVEKPEPKPVVQPPSVAVQAREQMNEGKYNEAIGLLKDAPPAKDNLATRGEARWLKYFQDQTAKKAPLDKNDPQVQQALEDLKEAKNEVFIAQINKTIEESELRAGLGKSDKTLLDLRDLLLKTKVADKLEPKDVPAALTNALKAKQGAEDAVARVHQALVDGKFIDAKEKFDVASFQKILKDLGDNKTVVVAVNKLLVDAKIKDAGPKGVEKLIAAKKDLDDKLEAVNKLLADEKIKDSGAKGLAELLQARTKLAKDRDELDQAIKTAYKELDEAKLVPAGGDPRAKILEGIKLARLKAESPLTIPLTQLASSLSSLGIGTGKLLEKGFDYAALTAELNFYRVREPFIQTPERKMDNYIAIFQDHNRKDAAEFVVALKEAAWLLSPEAKSAAEARAKALYVLGLVLRNQHQFDAAKKTLAEAGTIAAGLKDAGWAKQLERSIQELSDPAVSFLPRANLLASEGQLDKAIDMLTVGLDAMPGNARLLAQRSLLRLDIARAEGKISPDLGKAIRADAEAAVKDDKAAPSGEYALGQLEESLGNLDKAESHYRLALKTLLANRGKADDASRYRIALARLLLRDREPATTEPMGKNEPEPKKKVDAQPKKKVDVDPKKKDADPKNKDEKQEADNKDDVSSLELRDLVLLALVGVQPPRSGGDGPLPIDDILDRVKKAVLAQDENLDPRYKEIYEQARALIGSKEAKVRGEGYLILGQLLAKMGERTLGLKVYTEGLTKIMPNVKSQNLAAMIKEHPAFGQPDAAAKSDPVKADQFFGKGLHYYWTGKYADAEAQFQLAATFFAQDARYQYYLGLAQYGQKGNKQKRDAAFYAFEKAARLEAENRPSTHEVNTSLERLQGETRQFLNGFRKKAVVATNAK